METSPIHAKSPGPMKSDSPAQPSITKGREQSLLRVMGQSKLAGDLVDECAEELSSINEDIRRVLEDHDSVPGMETALEQNERVENKVKHASEELATINSGLESQIRDRSLLEHQFAAAVEQGGAARNAALHDVLTGLPNRALFDDRLQHGMAHAERHGWTMAVLFIDLDGFKKINDTHGHYVGDSILRTIAQRLKENTRSEDTVCRYGGDEFLFFSTEVRDHEHVELIAEKIVETIQAPCEVSKDGVTICLNITPSIGISLFPKDGRTAGALITQADAAMYRAKLAKSRYAFAT